MIVALMMSLALGGPLACDGEHESPECTRQLIAAATRNLSLPDIQTEFDAGVQVYRATFDGGTYGRPAVSFERRPGQSPELVVYGTAGSTLRREIGSDVWESVRERSRYVGRRFERVQAYSISCYVSSDVVVQISRPPVPKPNSNWDLPDYHLPSGGLIEASQNSCEGGLTWDYGTFLAELACEQIPACDAMGTRDQFMVVVDHLGSVFRLKGDRLAAASLYSDARLSPWRTHETGLEATEFSRWLRPEYGATLDWSGTIIKAESRYDDRSPDAISRFLFEQDSEGGGLSFEILEVGADSAEIGWVTGIMRPRSLWGSRKVPYRQVWLRSGDNWRLWSMTVGEFAETAPVQE